MQIFLKLESWLCGWLSLWQLFQILHLVKPSVHLHDMLQFKQKHLPSVASYASKKTAAWKVYSSLPHPISLPHYSQITSKYIKLFIFPLRLLHSSLKKKKVSLMIQCMISYFNNSIFSYFISYISTWSAAFYKFQRNTGAMSLADQRCFMKWLTITSGQTVTNTVKQSAVALSVVFS